MKKALYFFFFIFILFSLSCEKEERVVYSPCSQSLPGMICKEYRYDPDEFLGTVEYFYDENLRLVRQDLYSSSNNSRHIYYNYSDEGQLISRKVINDDSETKEYDEYTYNDFDSVSECSQHRDGSLYCVAKYDYDQQKYLSLKTITKPGNDIQYIEYEYDNGKLYKEVFKDNGHRITGYNCYDNYTNGVIRMRSYDAANNLTDVIINISDDKGNPVEKKIYTAGMILHQQEKWYYEDGLLMKYYKNNGDNSLIDYTVYQY